MFLKKRFLYKQVLDLRMLFKNYATHRLRVREERRVLIRTKSLVLYLLCGADCSFIRVTTTFDSSFVGRQHVPMIKFRKMDVLATQAVTPPPPAPPPPPHVPRGIWIVPQVKGTCMTTNRNCRFFA